ncbi:MAG: LamG-like jellyroll fold domain-containing protein, partial [Candidatus Thorarchaeota archaeon]
STYVTAGIWHHWCYVFNGAGAGNLDKAKIYIDGVERSDTQVSGTVPATIATMTGINFYYGYTSNTLDGKFADCRIYSDAKSATEISIIYQERGADGITTNLVSRHIMDELTTGTNCTGTVTDIQGNYNGTPANTPVYREVPLTLI